MTIVELCVHGKAKPHFVYRTVGVPSFECPGGRVLEQAIIIERDTDGEWPEWAILCCPDNDTEILDDLALASAQENQQ